MAQNEDEESEFDRDDNHDTSDCGHTDEEHAEMERKMKGRAERLQTNFKKFLAENAEDMMEEGQYDKLKTKVEKRLRRAGISPSLTSLKIFREGFEFGMMTFMQLGGEGAKVFAGINKIVADKENKIPKMEIDISKSKPLSTDEPPTQQ